MNRNLIFVIHAPRGKRIVVDDITRVDQKFRNSKVTVKEGQRILERTYLKLALLKY